jgi:hypothetical protein
VVMPRRAFSWLKYSVCAKARFYQVAEWLQTDSAVALENRRGDSWTVLRGTVGAGSAMRHAMPSA